MTEPSAGGALLAKALGGLGGTALALALILPNGWIDFAQRTVFSLVSGVMFGGVVAGWIDGWGLKTDDPFYQDVAGAGLAAVLAWPVLGFAYRLLSNSKNLDDLRGKK